MAPALAALATETSLLAGGAAALATALVSACLALNVRALGVPLSAPSTVFMGALAVFHLGLVAPWSAGWWPAPSWLEAAEAGSVSRALLCVVTAFCALELGLLAGWRRLSGRRQPPLAPVAGIRRVPSVFYGAGLLTAAAAVLAAFANLVVIGLQRFFGTSYGYELFADTDSRLAQTGLYWLMPAGLLIALAGARAGAEMRRVLAAGGAAVLVLFWLGDRGGAVSFAAAALVVRTGLRGAPSLRTAALGALGLLFVLPAVGALRLLPRNQISLADVRQVAIETSPLAALAEMGNSLRPLVETVRLVPGEVPHRLGRSYVGAAKRLVPNLGLSPAESAWTDPADLPPNHWLTYTVEPWTWAAFGGLGFSGIAEPYLNFGVPGIVGYFLALGFALGRADVWLAAGASRRRLALLAVVFMPLLLTVRNDFYNFVRPAVWGVSLVLVTGWVLGVRPARRAAVRRPGALGVPQASAS
jgi:hypothetical protein